MPVTAISERRTCTKCGIVLGDNVEIEHRGACVTVIEAGGMFILDVNAICKKCGEPIYHHMATKKLLELFRMIGRI